MEKDGYELTEQALIIVFGGVFGGQAFEVAQSGYPTITQMFLYLFILSVTLLTIFILHLLLAALKVNSESDE